jgi:phage head maturation protease
LWGKIKFADTRAGREAEAMVSRGELRSVSAGYSVEEWSIKDANGRTVDPEDVQPGDAGLTFWAESWTLYEVSLVAIPADQSAGIRSMSIGPLTSIHVVKTRMQARARMYARHTAYLSARRGARS